MNNFLGKKWKLENDGGASHTANISVYKLKICQYNEDF